MDVRVGKQNSIVKNNYWLNCEFKRNFPSVRASRKVNNEKAYKMANKRFSFFQI
jgi:hypothetical protein